MPQTYLDALNEPTETELWLKRIENDLSMSIYVGELDGVLCGFISGGRLRKPVEFYDPEVYSLYLLSTTRGKGIGRSLFTRMAGELARQELRNLLVWVLAENPFTAFYDKLGGIVVANSALEIGGKQLPSVAYGWSNYAAKSWQ